MNTDKGLESVSICVHLWIDAVVLAFDIRAFLCVLCDSVVKMFAKFGINQRAIVDPILARRAALGAGRTLRDW